MAYFKQIKNFEKCLNAIKEACKSELWLDSLVKKSEQMKQIPYSTNVLLHWWQCFQDTDLDFIFENRCTENAEYYYEDSNGRLLHIAEYKRRSHVYHYNGFPDSLVEELENKSHEQLYDIIDNKLCHYINEDDFDLKIEKTNGS